MGQEDKAREIWLRGVEVMTQSLAASPDNLFTRAWLAQLHGYLGDLEPLKEHGALMMFIMGTGITVSSPRQRKSDFPADAALA